MLRPVTSREEDLLSTADAAKILRLSADMVRLLARAGRLRAAAASVRGVRLFLRRDVEALAAERAGTLAHHHTVQFYEGDEFLIDVVSDFLTAGMKARGPLIVVATAERREAVLARLTSKGQRPKRAIASGQLTMLDARETLDRFMVEGLPDAKLFRKHMGKLVGERSGKRRARLYVYGEMVNILCGDGLPDAAIRFEELWNDLGHAHRHSRLCTYSMEHFRTGADSTMFERVCALHTRVVPNERCVESSDPTERLRRLAVLEQRAHALDGEMERRKHAERELLDMKPQRTQEKENERDGRHSRPRAG